MKKVRFVCRDCGCRFAVEVLEEGEAEEKGLSGYHVKCRDCGSIAVERD